MNADLEARLARLEKLLRPAAYPTGGGGLGLAVDPAGTHGRVQFPATLTTFPESPPQITSDQNDYVLGDTSWLRLSSDATRAITGFAGGAHGRHLVLDNVGTKPIILKNQDAGSATINQILTGSAGSGFSTVTFGLGSGRRCMLIYDQELAAWRLYAPQFSGAYVAYGPGSVTSGANLVWASSGYDLGDPSFGAAYWDGAAGAHPDRLHCTTGGFYLVGAQADVTTAFASCTLAVDVNGGAGNGIFGYALKIVGDNAGPTLTGTACVLLLPGDYLTANVAANVTPLDVLANLWVAKLAF